MTETSASGVTYSLRVPSGYDVAAGGLVVIGLHGQGGSHDQFIRVLEQAGYLSKAVLIAPNASADAAWQESDVEPVAKLVDEARRRYRALRVIVFGYSRGAYFSFALGLRHPEAIDAVIAHSGGLIAPIPPAPAARSLPFYVIHGDQDGTVPPQQSQDAVARLRGAGFARVEHDEVKGLPHRIDPAATQRGFAWVERILGPAAPALDAAAAEARIAAIDKAVRAKDGAAAAEAFRGLERAPASALPKVARLAKKHADADDEAVATAALECAGGLGEAGLAALAKGIKDKRDAVAIAAASGLGSVGGDAATDLLIAALGPAEQKDRTEVAGAIREALTAITGERHADAVAWRRWRAAR